MRIVWYMFIPPLVTVQPLGMVTLKSEVSYSSVSTDLAADAVIFMPFSASLASFFAPPLPPLPLPSVPPGTADVPPQAARVSTVSAAAKMLMIFKSFVFISFYPPKR